MTTHGTGSIGRRWIPDPLARRPIVPLLILAAAVLLWQLGAYGLWESTEARYAEIAARMLRSGDWLVPRLNHVAHFEKPPLAYWASAAGMALVGIGELGARLPLVATALAALAIVHRSARALGGPRAATYAVLATLSAPLFFALARSVTTDLYLTLAVVAAVEAGRRGSRPGARRGWRIAAWAALGAGFLAKGPVALLWTGAPALVWAAWTGRWRRLARLADLGGVLIALAIALPWYLHIAAERPGLLEHWLGEQTRDRMTVPIEGEGDPWWAYVPVLGWAVGPWILPAALELVRARTPGRDARRYLLVWVVVPLVTFALFPTKRANYLLPLVPALTIAAGIWWAGAERDDRPGGRSAVRVMALLVAGFGGALLGAGLHPESRASLPGPLPALGVFLGPTFLLGGLGAWLASGRRRLDVAFAALVVPILGLYVGGYGALARPRVEAWFKISRPLAAAAAVHRTADEPLVAVYDWPRAFPFYLDDRLLTVETGERAAIFEPDSSWREWIVASDSVLAGWDRRTLFVVPRDRVDRLERALGEPVTVLGATRRHLLVTNRPTPSERARREPLDPSQE